MPSFYDDLIASRPGHVHDLWPHLDSPHHQSSAYWVNNRKGRSGNFDACTLAEHLDVWAEDEELHNLIESEEDSASLFYTFELAADTSTTMIYEMHIQTDLGSRGTILISSCKGCNRFGDVTSREFDGEDSNTKDMSTADNFCSMIHILITSLGVINHLLLRRDCDKLILKLTSLPPGGPSRRNIMDRLLYLISTCSVALPKVGIAASTMMSLLVARRPAGSFASVSDSALLVSCLSQYTEYTHTTCLEEFCWKAHWGAISLVRIVPLLYQIGRWKLVADHLSQSLCGVLASCTIGLVSVREQAEGYTSGDCRELLWPLLQRESDNESDCSPRRYSLFLESPGTYAAAAALEILARWAENGILASATVEGSSGEHISVAALIAVHEEAIQAMIQEWSPVLDYLGPLVSSLAKGQVPQQPSREASLLYDPLRRAQMRCGLPSCRSTVRASDETKELLACQGGCDGLEMYCSREHQKQHWPSHKRFCKSSKKM